MRELKAIVRAWEYTVMRRELSHKTPLPEVVPEERACFFDCRIRALMDQYPLWMYTSR